VEFPEAGLDPSCAGELDLIHDLMLLNIGELYKKVIINDAKKTHENIHKKGRRARLVQIFASHGWVLRRADRRPKR
jgi:hypothetical protein